MAEPPAKKPQVLFGEPEDWTDLVLVVGEKDEERKFHFCHAVLCVASPVFKAMLTQDFKEKDAEQILLPGDDPWAFEELLQFISPRHHNNVTDDNLPLVLPIACKYQVSHVLKLCEERLISILPEKFGFSKRQEYICSRALIGDIASKVCGDDLGKWMETSFGPYSQHADYTSSYPWWCVLLELYVVAKDFNLPELKETDWEKLMDTSNSSVWCSSVGLNLPGTYSSGGYAEFKPLDSYLNGGSSIPNDKNTRLNFRFSPVGISSCPFFTKLDPEEKVDVLLSFTTFQTTCKIFHR